MAILIPPEMLLEAYRQGAFPMAVEPGDIRWFSPQMRGILPLEGFHVPHGTRRALKDPSWEIRIDTAFPEVMNACAQRRETWIDDVILASYGRLHEQGHAHSVEVWRGGALAGGLYGVAIGGAFFGESMFHRVTNASKVALVRLVEVLRADGFTLLDTQWTTPHLGQFGASEIPRARYMRLLAEALEVPAIFGASLRRASSGEALPLPSRAGAFHNLRMSDSPAVDWEQLDMIADGYTPDFVEIYREFEMDLPRILRETGEALAGGDAVRTSRAAHQAKGSAANFGFTGFSATMARIEQQAKGGSLDGLDGELAKAERIFRESLAEVKAARGI